MVNKASIRVMIVDDSSFARDIIATILSSDPTIEVVATAIDGQDALDKLLDVQPDLITMDIVMPRMGGLEAIEHIMAFHATPILVATAQQDAHVAFQALSKGALDVVEKPTFENMSDALSQKEFIDKIKLLANVKVITHLSGRRTRQVDASPKPVHRAQNKIVAIAASTGGPKVLAKIFSQLPANLNVAIVVVQHIADGFAQSLVDWLNSVAPINVKLAERGENIVTGTAYIAPTGTHLEFSQKGTVTLSRGEKEEGQCPSANVLLRSIATTYGRNALGIILTGMGQDGARGMLELKQKGAATLAQNQESCVVFGMPKAAIDKQAIDKVLSIEAIAEEIIQFAEKS